MVKLATAGREEFFVEDCEIRRRGTSYTMETIDYLSSAYPVEGRIGLIIGDDLIGGFQTWKMVDRLLSTVDIIVAHRESPESVTFPGKATFLENALLPISYSEIRKRVREKRAFRYLVPEAVYRCIERENLYKHG
jgi:nicotinate-nucleotide adenylyltransferase